MNREKCLQRYRALVEEVQRECERFRADPNWTGCHPECDTCCRGTSLLSILPAEMEAMRRGLEKLPKALRRRIYERARSTIKRAIRMGYDFEKLSQVNPSDVITEIGLRDESVCPFLVAGVCAIYDDRPLICIIWGYPMFDGKRTNCCAHTYRGDLSAVDGVDFKAFRDRAFAIGAEENCGEKSIPMAYAVLLLKNEIDPEDDN